MAEHQPWSSAFDRKVALNLSDLNINHSLESRYRLGTPSANPTPTRSKPTTSSDSRYRLVTPTKASLEDSPEYEQELSKLYTKSKGTNYESVIKRFVESKISHSSSSKISPNKTSKKLDLSKLISSLRGDEVRDNDDSDALSTRSERASRLDNLSRPLESQTWRGPNVGYGNISISRVSTNHLGRQRPSPTPVDRARHSLDDSEFRATNAQRSISNSQSRRSQNSSPSLRLRQSSSAVVEQSIREGQDMDSEGEVAPEAGVAVVSISDFNKWLACNQKWKETASAKVRSMTEELSRKDKISATPRINLNSDKLSEAANLRLVASAGWTGAEDNNVTCDGTMNLESENKKPLNTSSTSRTSSPAQSGKPGGTSTTTTNDNYLKSSHKSQSLEEFTVYDRLSLRGRSKAREYRDWTPPARTSSFSPTISARSRVLACRHRSREICSTSPTLKHHHQKQGRQSEDSFRGHDDGNTSRYDQASVTPSRTSRNSSQSPSPRPRTPLSSKSMTGGDNSTSSSSLPMSPAHHNYIQQQFSVTPRSSREGNNPDDFEDDTSCTASQYSYYRRKRSNSKDRVTSDLCKSKEKALKVLNMKKNFGKEHLYRVEDDRVSKPFQPTLIAKETHKIMASKDTSFPDRVAKSVENYYVRKAVAENADRPGPMHYSKAVDVAHVSRVLSPGRLSRQPEEDCPNRAAASGGHTFAKTPTNKLLVQSPNHNNSGGGIKVGKVGVNVSVILTSTPRNPSSVTAMKSDNNNSPPSQPTSSSSSHQLVTASSSSSRSIQLRLKETVRERDDLSVSTTHISSSEQRSVANTTPSKKVIASSSHLQKTNSMKR